MDEKIENDENGKLFDNISIFVMFFNDLNADRESELEPDDLYTGDYLPTNAKDKYGFFVSNNSPKQFHVAPEVQRARDLKEQSRARKWLNMHKYWKSFFSVTKTKEKLKENNQVKLVVHTTDNNNNHHNQSETSDSPNNSNTTLQPRIPEVLTNGYRVYYSNKLKSRVRKGIPNQFRGFAWYEFSLAEIIATRYPDPAHDIDISCLSTLNVEEIERDVDRTFPRHILFTATNSDYQCKLRLLLRWYAALDREANYCQGMGFVAALFLIYLQDEKLAFHVFYSALTRDSCPLRLIYKPKLIEMQKMLYVMDYLGDVYLPRLWSHFKREGMHVTMFFTEWTMGTSLYTIYTIHYILYY
jgi:hypothetical protein